MGLPYFCEALGIGFAIPWLILWSAVLLPAALFGFSSLVAIRRESPWERVLIYLLALALIAAMTGNLRAIEQALRASALQAVLG